MSLHTINRLSAVILLIVWSNGYIQQTTGQSNYASRANDVEYQGEGLPGEATLDGKVSCISNIVTDGANEPVVQKLRECLNK